MMYFSKYDKYKASLTIIIIWFLYFVRLKNSQKKVKSKPKLFQYCYCCDQNSDYSNFVVYIKVNVWPISIIMVNIIHHLSKWHTHTVISYTFMPGNTCTKI